MRSCPGGGTNESGESTVPLSFFSLLPLPAEWDVDLPVPKIPGPNPSDKSRYLTVVYAQ